MEGKDLWLLSYGATKLNVVTAIWQSTEYSLDETRQLVNNAPSLILSASFGAEKLKEVEKAIVSAGGVVDYKSSEADDSNYQQKQVDSKVSDVKNVFQSETSNWFGEKNDYDCLYGNIPEGKMSDARQNFGISFDENIIFIRDTGFWNLADQGLVITDKALYILPDNDKPEEKAFVPWTAMQKVEYKDLILNIYANFTDGPGELPIKMSFLTKTSDEKRQAYIGRNIAALFNKVCESLSKEETPEDIAVAEIDKLIADSKDEEALQLALNAYNKSENSVILLYYISKLYKLKKDYSAAISYCDRLLSQVEEGSSMYVFAMYLKEGIYADNEDYNQARKYAFLAKRYATNEVRDDGESIKEDAKNDFNICERKYVDDFLQMPYNQRKILLPVNEYVDLSQKQISVIDINNLPNIQFPIGHPVANQLYVGHPYLPNKYMPFENYQLELIEDKVREFCQIAQCLGATEISIDAVNTSQSSSSSDVKQNVNGEGSYRLASGKGSVDKKKKNSLIQEISQAIALHQRFTPTKEPYLPNSMVWYQHEPSWKRLYEQRVNGGLTEHEERIETRKSQVVDNNQLQEVKAELESLFAEANLNWNASLDEKFSQQENAVLAIHVKFAPVDSIANGKLPSLASVDETANNTFAYTAEETEYLESVKDFLEDDAEITPREKKMLDRIRKNLGISEERAMELEESLKPQLTDDEKEYLEMYKDYASEGEISEKNRRRLDKFAKALSIAADRQAEIEKM